MRFAEWLFQEGVHYHGTSKENAASIIANGPDPSKYRSGMFRGFYLAPSLSYFHSKAPEVILAVEIDESKIIDKDAVTDEELAKIDPHFRMMSYGYKNTLIEKYALANGYSGVRNGVEVILFNKSAIRSIKVVDQ